MKTVHRLMASILNLVMLVLLVSCASVPVFPDYTPNDSSVQNMSVEQALEVIKNNVGMKFAVKGDQQWSEVTKILVTSNKLIIKSSRGVDSDIKFSEINNILASHRLVTVLCQSTFLFTYSENNTYLHKSIANALYVLKHNKTKIQEEYNASISASLAEYRKKAALNNALPEEAHRYKVQAEGAVRDKQFDDAAYYYVKALIIAPWWPVGHFNRALVLGEAGDYREAMREMKFYLQLVPDAPNARAAQDKIYDWERKAGKGN